MRKKASLFLPLEERLLRRIQHEPNTGCWLWTGPLQNMGYGHLAIGSRVDGNYRRVLAHRLSYQLFIGEVPNGLKLDHLCRVRRCSNPWHLEPVTRKENVNRGLTPLRYKNRTHCEHGHELNTENLRKNGRCRPCVNAANRAYERRVKEKMNGC